MGQLADALARAREVAEPVPSTGLAQPEASLDWSVGRLAYQVTVSGSGDCGFVQPRKSRSCQRTPAHAADRVLGSSHNGAVLDGTRSFPATAYGYQQLLS